MSKNNSIDLKPIFSGLLKFTTKDDFGNLSATLFTLGCNLRCKYCYNIKFLDFDKNKLINNDEIISFLEKRVDMLDSIVICGGEPTIHNDDLIDWIKYIKSLGYRVKLDTNGTNPETLKKIIDKDLVDFIALDFKGLDYNLKNITQASFFDKFEQSLSLILNSNIEYDIRTTVHSLLLDSQDIFRMRDYLKKNNCKKWSLQKFLNVKVLDSNIKKDDSDMSYWDFKNDFDGFEIRN